MPSASDFSGIQFRLLNRSKGPAVQGPRTQIDRKVYKNYVYNSLVGLKNLSILSEEVSSLVVDNNKIKGVVLSDRKKIYAKSIILTTGTFLNGKIHIGDKSFSGGRKGDSASINLADFLYDLKLPMGRLKTGTPPRLLAETINWKELEKQNLDQTINTLSMLSPFSLEEKQVLLETINLFDRKKKLEEILKTYINDSFSNKTLQ